MAIDLKKMKAKLNALNNKGGGKTQYFSPKEGQTYNVRILPDSVEGDPFKERWFHYEITKSGILCPKKNFGHECPICDFAKKLYAEKTEDSAKLAKKFNARQRFFSAVVVRGEEKDGVKVWSYGKNVYQDLLGLVTNEEYGDITDPQSGTDLKVTALKAAGQQFAIPKVTPARSTSKLCKDPDECAELMESVPDFTELHKEPTLKEVSQALDEYLSGGASNDEEAEEVSSETSKYGTKAATKKAPAASDSDDELDELLSA